MKSFAFLYCRGHRVVTVLIMVLCIGSVLWFDEGWALNIPWLNDTARVNIGTLCSFSYAVLPVIFSKIRFPGWRLRYHKIGCLLTV